MERNIEVNGTEIIGNVFGSFDENIKLIENELDVAVVNRDGKIKVCGGEDGIGGKGHKTSHIGCGTRRNGNCADSQLLHLHG